MRCSEVNIVIKSEATVSVQSRPAFKGPCWLHHRVTASSPTLHRRGWCGWVCVLVWVLSEWVTFMCVCGCMCSVCVAGPGTMSYRRTGPCRTWSRRVGVRPLIIMHVLWRWRRHSHLLIVVFLKVQRLMMDLPFLLFPFFSLCLFFLHVSSGITVLHMYTCE